VKVDVAACSAEAREGEDASVLGEITDGQNEQTQQRSFGAWRCYTGKGL
jgi:hypothetical protein